jgi:NitT/TauT family transport system permease protein
MLVVILIYDLVLFRPLVAWADRFRFEQQAGLVPPKSWVLNILRRSGIIARLNRLVSVLWRRSFQSPLFGASNSVRAAPSPDRQRWGDRLWTGTAVAVAAVTIWEIGRFVFTNVALADVGQAVLLGLATLARVVVLIALASLIWVPIGVWVGTRPHVKIRR